MIVASMIMISASMRIVENIVTLMLTLAAAIAGGEAMIAVAATVEIAVAHPVRAAAVAGAEIDFFFA
jgi:hypothetical protein